MSIKLKVTLMLSVLGFVSVAAGIYLFTALSVAKNDANIIEVLGRQRMLTQAMAKGVLGTATAKDIFAGVENRVSFIDTYMTKMRGSYTRLVIASAKEANIAVSMTPETDSHPSVPFPATLTRIVNAENSKAATDFTIDVISDNPINPNQAYKTEMDKKAGAHIQANLESTYFEAEKSDNGMFLNFYTPDRAVVQGCADCHAAMEGRPYKVGDLLGIRKYRVHLTKDAALGEKMLNPSLVEYEKARQIFTETLSAMKSGGRYPTDLALKNYAEVEVIDNEQSQAIMVDIEAKFAEMEIIVGQVLNAKNSEDRFKSVTTMVGLSNQLRKVSNDLVVQFTGLANDNQASISISIIISTAIIVFTVIAVFVFVSQSVLKKFATLADGMEVLSGGNTSVDIAFVDNTDEVGDMAKAVQVFKDNALEMQRLEVEQKEAEKRAEQEKIEAMNNMADDFETNVGGIVNAVSTASTELQSSSDSMTSLAQQTTSQADTVAVASEDASSNVQTVASAAEELSSSINEISRQVSQSTDIANTAVSEVDGANEKVQGLADAANKIGEVVALITDIADQTNLLALNATIEAARAGDAGKGFAVVASEVKNLANQTAKATEEISSQIGGIQSATEEAVQAIGSIGGIINQMSEISSTIAAAVEEQGAATKEIARNVEQAATGTTQVSNTIQSVTEDAGQSGSAAAQIQDAVKELSHQADNLRSQVDTFLKQVRTG